MATICADRDRTDTQGVIIASTDKKLTPNSWIPDSFIPVYVKAYEEGRVITEVLLEFKEPINPYYTHRDLKIRADGSVIIHQAKFYSREEAIKFVKKALKESKIAYSELDRIGVDDWAEKHIK
jgi:hypothetical protein